MKWTIILRYLTGKWRRVLPATPRSRASARCRSVTSGDILKIPSPIWHTKGSTAQSVHQRIRSVLEWAVAMEFRTDNPCDRVRSVRGPQHRVVQQLRALPHREVGSAIR